MSKKQLPEHKHDFIWVKFGRIQVTRGCKCCGHREGKLKGEFIYCTKCDDAHFTSIKHAAYHWPMAQIDLEI